MSRRIWLDPTSGGGHHSARRIDIEPNRHFTRVALDRDEYVYNARRDGRDAEVELSPQFAAALRRCSDAAYDHLWAHGYSGGFTNSIGPSHVDLNVPYSLADQAAEALRAAEMEGDVTGLDALTAALAVPLDQWLRPGDRELRRGVDFSATPTAFLTFLRAKARERGLRLNGRAIPGAVWVRPEMPAASVELRTRYPDQFAHYPDPALYADHPHQADDQESPERPYVGARSSGSARDATPVKFLQPQTPPPGSEPCPCGYPGAVTDDDDPGHARGHLQWSTGVLIPSTLKWAGGSLNGGIAAVTATSPLQWRKLAYACALLPKRENHYDFASFALGDGEPAENNPRAYLYRAGRRVVGFVSVFDATHARWYPLPIETSKAVAQTTAGDVRPVVNVIFTATIWRRRGVAAELAVAISAEAGIPEAGVAWSTPLSPAGQALATRTAPAGLWLT